MRYLSLDEVLKLHEWVVSQSGGSFGTRDKGALESAIAQPQSSFDGKDLYPSLVEKAIALAYSLAMNHPFIDGNKRIAHLAMETFLFLNGHEVAASIDDQEKMFLGVAGGEIKRGEFEAWLESKIVTKQK